MAVRFFKITRLKNILGLEDSENIFSPKGQEIRGRAKDLTKKQQAKYIDGRLGLLVDGTGKDYAKIKKLSDALRKIGYDTYMMFVNTSLDTAQQRT